MEGIHASLASVRLKNLPDSQTGYGIVKSGRERDERTAAYFKHTGISIKSYT
jgi:hypothetical protein